MNLATAQSIDFGVQSEVKDLIRQCLVQFCCQLIEETLIDQEAIFIDALRRKTGSIHRQRKIDVEPVFGFFEGQFAFHSIFRSRKIEG